MSVWIGLWCRTNPPLFEHKKKTAKRNSCWRYKKIKKKAEGWCPMPLIRREKDHTRTPYSLEKSKYHLEHLKPPVKKHNFRWEVGFGDDGDGPRRWWRPPIWPFTRNLKKSHGLGPNYPWNKHSAIEALEPNQMELKGGRVEKNWEFQLCFSQSRTTDTGPTAPEHAHSAFVTAP